jgi:hypothetical protein
MTQRHYIRPGKPVENAFAESFIGRLRDGDEFLGCVPDLCGNLL